MFISLAVLSHLSLFTLLLSPPLRLILSGCLARRSNRLSVDVRKSVEQFSLVAPLDRRETLSQPNSPKPGTRLKEP